MRPAYFLSDFDALAGFPTENADHLKKDLPDGGRLLWVASSPSAYDQSVYYSNVYRRWLQQCGISFGDDRLLDDRVDAAEAQRLIGSASCIF